MGWLFLIKMLFDDFVEWSGEGDIGHGMCCSSCIWTLYVMDIAKPDGYRDLLWEILLWLPLVELGFLSSFCILPFQSICTCALKSFKPYWLCYWSHSSTQISFSSLESLLLIYSSAFFLLFLIYSSALFDNYSL